MSLRLVLLLIASLVATGAAAQAPTADADAASLDRARALFAEGVAALDGGDCPGALAKFREAYELAREPSILYNLATAEAECHDPVEAAGHYRQFLNDVHSGRAARFRGEAQRQLRTIERSLAHMNLVLTGAQPDDLVLVDDRRLDQAALGDVEVSEGEHLLTVRRGNRQVATARVTFAAAEHRQVELAVVDAPVPTPAEVAQSNQAPADERHPLERTPDPRRRRIAIGASSAVAAVFAAMVVVYTTR